MGRLLCFIFSALFIFVDVVSAFVPPRAQVRPVASMLGKLGIETGSDRLAYHSSRSTSPSLLRLYASIDSVRQMMRHALRAPASRFLPSNNFIRPSQPEPSDIGDGAARPSRRNPVAWFRSKMTRKNLAAAGMSVILSYGFVSNINRRVGIRARSLLICVTLSIPSSLSCTMLAWVWAKYVKDNGFSPFVAFKPPFFTPKFFAYYGAGFVALIPAYYGGDEEWPFPLLLPLSRSSGAVYITIGSALRPLRAVLAGAISPAFAKVSASDRCRLCPTIQYFAYAPASNRGFIRGLTIPYFTFTAPPGKRGPALRARLHCPPPYCAPKSRGGIITNRITLTPFPLPCPPPNHHHEH